MSISGNVIPGVLIEDVIEQLFYQSNGLREKETGIVEGK